MTKINADFPPLKLGLALVVYSVAMTLGLPFILAYLHWRGSRDKLYSQHMAERFGIHEKGLENSVWVHATSLGEVRSAAPLIERLLGDSENVVVTVHTPSGRRETTRLFGEAIEQEKLKVVYVPLEMRRAWRRFFASFKPAYGLVMETEMWPWMITSANSNGVPLFLSNAQYPTKSYKRDRKRFRLRTLLVSGFAGVMAKSSSEAEKFLELGARQIAVTGELRFDIAVPQEQVERGKAARAWLGAEGKKVIVFSSAVIGEDDAYLEVMDSVAQGLAKLGKPKPLFVYVPRAPERFADVGSMLEGKGYKVGKRSALFDDGLKPKGESSEIDVLLGDSIGEMHCYIAMGDAVVVGGGFTAKGAHNIIEALTQRKPVFVGPNTWTIEHPMEEALEAKVAARCTTPREMSKELLDQLQGEVDQKSIDDFCKEHGNATERSMDALSVLLEGAKITKH